MNRDSHSHKVFSEYREFPAPPQLSSRFLCFWTQSVVGFRGDYRHWVLPDGCVDIVFINDDPPVVVGPWTDPFIVTLVAGTTIVGARLSPGKAASVLGLPAVELRNSSVPLADVWGARSKPFARIHDEPSQRKRMSVLVEALLETFTFGVPVDEAVVAGIRWLGEHPNGRVEQLSQWIGISNRHLQRRFAATVGYGPKMFQSILRFQRLLNLASGIDVQRRLAQLAVDAGYADQAHMTREVQRFAKSSPTVLLGSDRCTLSMSDLFKTHASLCISLSLTGTSTLPGYFPG